MKKITCTLITVIIALLSSSATLAITSEQIFLKKLIEEANAECPLDLGTFGNMTSILYNPSENIVKAVVSVSPEFEAIVGGDYDMSTVKQMMSYGLASTNEEDHVLDFIIAANAKFQYILLFSSGKRHTITFTVDELHSITRIDTSDPALIRQQAQSFIEQENSLCPIDYGDGSKLKRVVLVNDWVIFVNECNSSIYTLSFIEDNKASLRENILSRVLVEPGAVAEITTYAKAGYGLCYRYYVGSQYCDAVVVTNSELRSLFGL